MDGFTSNLVVCKENYGYRFVDVCLHQVPCGADASLARMDRGRSLRGCGENCVSNVGGCSGRSDGFMRDNCLIISKILNLPSGIYPKAKQGSR